MSEPNTPRWHIEVGTTETSPNPIFRGDLQVGYVAAAHARELARLLPPCKRDLPVRTIAEAKAALGVKPLCDHLRHITVSNSPVLTVHWCPSCGAIRRQFAGAGASPAVWHLPDGA